MIFWGYIINTRAAVCHQSLPPRVGKEERVSKNIQEFVDIIYGWPPTKAALEAVNGFNLYGELGRGSPCSIVYVDIDAHNRNRS